MSESSQDSWYLIDNADEVPSPALLLYPDRIKSNIQRMIKMAGSPERLRPHVKTYKMAEIVRMQMEMGISKFKCATISETEMVAECGVKDILMAMQPVGPNIKRFFQLKQAFPGTNISCIVDSEEVIRELSEIASGTGLETHIWLDINNGMNRTGVSPGKDASRLIQLIKELPGLKAEGLHVYDGHIREKDVSLREKICNESFAPVMKLITELKKAGISQLKIIAGGTSTFPFHATRPGVECSPGTLILWDYGYSSSFPDLDFLFAAVLINRIISKPAKDLICLDLGYKAIASEMSQPRIIFHDIKDYSIVSQNEEHMVVRTTEAANLNIGDSLYGIPRHICPTVDRYDSVFVVHEHKVTEQWDVVARKRKITF